MSNDSQQIMLPKWAADALPIAAGICLIVSLYLAIADRVPAGTLAAGLFVVCVLFHYLPQMQSFKAWGVEATWRRELKDKEEVVRREDARLAEATKELDAQIAAIAPANKELAAGFGKVHEAITRLSTANNELSATIGAVGNRSPFSTTRKSE